MGFWGVTLLLATFYFMGAWCKIKWLTYIT